MKNRNFLKMFVLASLIMPAFFAQAQSKTDKEVLMTIGDQSITVKDFTDKALMDATAKKVTDGLTAMNTNAVNISNKIDKIPKTVTAELSYDTTIRLHDISDNLRWIIIVFAIFVVLLAGLGGYTLYQYTKVNERSENLTQWYEDNRESILFGRYVRWNNNDTWKKLHEKWESDPGLKDEMFDYFQMEERDGNIERK